MKLKKLIKKIEMAKYRNDIQRKRWMEICSSKMGGMRDIEDPQYAACVKAEIRFRMFLTEYEELTGKEYILTKNLPGY